MLIGTPAAAWGVAAGVSERSVWTLTHERMPGGGTGPLHKTAGVPNPQLYPDTSPPCHRRPALALMYR
jgi:hypothetical protein